MAQGIKSNISKEQLETLLQSYTLNEIAEKLDVSIATIKRYKSKYGLKVNPEVAQQKNVAAHTKYKYDLNYFENINNLNKAYLLGFICADGFVTTRNEIGIGVQKSDIDVVKFFKEQLKTDKEIKDKTNSVELRVQNKKLYDDITKYKVIPNKSLVLNIEEVIKLAELNDKQIKAFLLGYFDGDGGIYCCETTATPQWSMNITGTLETCNYYKKYFNDVGFMTKRHDDDKNNYTYQIGGCNLVEQSLNSIYEIKDEIDFYYKRKYDKYLKLKEYNLR